MYESNVETELEKKGLQRTAVMRRRRDPTSADVESEVRSGNCTSTMLAGKEPTLPLTLPFHQSPSLD